jgi:hypothetical protein
MNKQSLRSKLTTTQAQTALVAALCAVPLAGFAGSPGVSNPAGQLTTSAASQSSGAPKEVGQPKPFDPARCKGGEKGYVYWAARDQVFKFRFDPALPIYPRLGQGSTPGDAVAKGMTEIPPAPDPLAPEGCYGNPLRGSSVPYMEEFSDKLFLTTFGVAKERRISFGNGYSASLQRLVGSGIGPAARISFAKSSFCRQRASGMHECLDGKSRNLDDYSIGRMLMLGKQQLSRRTDAPDLFLFLAPTIRQSTSAAGAEMQFKSEFDLFDAVRLSDHSIIWSNQIDFFIPYFSGLIEYVNSAHVPGYSWAQVKSK